MDEVICRDLYLKHTDKRGLTNFRRYRVWDAERKLQAEMAAADKEKGKIEIATEQEYLDAQPPRSR